MAQPYVLLIRTTTPLLYGSVSVHTGCIRRCNDCPLRIRQPVIDCVHLLGHRHRLYPDKQDHLPAATIERRRTTSASIHAHIAHRSQVVEWLGDVDGLEIWTRVADPAFVASFEIGQYVYFFFRETAVEYANCGAAVYSRVARICKVGVE